MPTARTSAAAAVDKNIIYVIGGYSNSGGRLNTVESYNPATNTWTEESPLLVGKSEPSVGLVGSTIVAAGGYSTSEDTGDNEGYDVSTNSWTSLATEPTGTNASCTGSAKGSLYLAGGSNSSGNAVDNTQSFKLTKNKWTTQAALPQAAASLGSAVYKGVLYCFGGGSASTQFVGNVYDNVQIYQP